MILAREAGCWIDEHKWRIFTFAFGEKLLKVNMYNSKSTKRLVVILYPCGTICHHGDSLWLFGSSQ